jgi:uncharacterized membrane protein YdbT with pleckstrin-like domain
MSRYINANLLNNERVCYSARLSLWALTRHVVIGGLIIVCKGGWLLDYLFFDGQLVYGLSRGGLIIAALFLGAAGLKYATTELVVTNKRVFARFGVSKRTSIELLLSKVESVQVQQSILGRLLNYGSIEVAGGGMYSAPVPNISSPGRFRTECTKAQMQP